MTKRYTLLNGHQIPLIGFGTYKLKGSTATDMTVKAIKEGYRLFDTASMYENEKEIGQGIRQAIEEKAATREELFVVTKIWKTDMGYNQSKKAFEKSFNELGLDYIDLLLIHWPGDTEEINVDTWKAFEELYRQDKRIHAIGVSNFSEDELIHLFKQGTIKPMVNQFSSYPGNSQQKLLDFCYNEKIISMAYSPIDRGGVESIELIQKLSKKYKKTPAQIALRWAIDRKIIPIPKTSKGERLKENMDVWDFELTEKEINELLALG